MKRPSLYLFVLVIFGILLGHSLFNNFWVMGACSGLGLILVLVFGYRRYKNNLLIEKDDVNNKIFRVIMTVSCLVSVFCCLKAVYINYEYSERSDNNKFIKNIIDNNNNIYMQGIVTDIGSTTTNNLKLVVESSSVNREEFNKKILVYVNLGYLEHYAEKYMQEYLQESIEGYMPDYKNYYYLDENTESEIPIDLREHIINYIKENADINNMPDILGYVREYALRYIKVGDYISLKGSLDFAGIQKNPNAYDEELVFVVNNIYCKMYANRFEILENNGFLNNFLSYTALIRQNIFDIYDQILPPTESSILKAMLIGDKQFLEDDTTSLYQEAGIYHILAISGLHIGCLAGILTKILERFHKVYGKLLVILILIFYCVIAGGSISTVRATLMYTMAILGNVFFKNDDFLSCICISGVILLVINPFYLFDIGFLYSFVAVICIAMVGSRIAKVYELNKFIATLLVSFFVCISLKPITAYYFYNLQLYDMFLNIIILPFMSLVVFIGFVATIIGAFNIYLAEFFIGTVYYILKLFTYLATFVTNLKFNSIVVGRPSFLFMFSFYLVLVLIAFAFYDKYKVKKRLKYINIGLLVFVVSMIICVMPKKSLTITVLDIGQGDSIVGSCSAGDFLIDGGGERYSNTGDYIVLPYLRSQGINKLEFVFISHEDTDHIKGILEIIGDIEIEYIFLPKTTPRESNFIELMNLAEEYNIEVYFLDKGDVVYLGEDLRVEVIYPYEVDDFYRVGANNNSLVFKLFYEDTSMLFTGDIEATVEKFLVSSLGDDLNADILKVGHHGSKTSTSQEFLEAVDPQIALISCKLNNIYNHPSEEVIERLEGNLTHVYRTDLQNAIILEIKDNNIRVKTLN
ncbi:MAG: DNA internalization-related competence protein ComEC/Rec2 [bacterium]